VLFQFTKTIFEKWLSQIISLVVQPVILFAALSMLFMVGDKIIFGDNHEFVPAEVPIPVQVANFSDDAIDAALDGRERPFDIDYYDSTPVNYKIKYTEPDADDLTKRQLQIIEAAINEEEAPVFDDGDDQKPYADFPGECADDTSIVCIYQTAINKDGSKFPSDTVAIFTKKQLDMDNETASIYLNGLLNLLALCFIINLVMGSVQELSARITDAIGGAGGGIAGMSAAPTSSPAGLAIGAASAVKGAVKKGKQANKLRKKPGEAKRKLAEYRDKRQDNKNANKGLKKKND
jgi:hypothetical protein